VAGAGRYWWIWLAVVPVAAWALLRLLGLDGGSMLAVPMAFTPYAAIAALLVTGVALALGNWPATAVAALAAACLAAAILPRAIGDGTEPADGRETLTVLSANVHRGTADPEALVAAVERLHPDLLSLQELTPRFAGRLRAAGLRRSMTDAVLTVDPKWPRIPGLGLYSRLPMRRIGPLSTRILTAAVRMPSGATVRVADVHPHTPKPGHLDSWRHSLEVMPSAGRGTPWVLVGDFNATLDQEQLRDVVDRGYRDAGEVAGQGLEPTWPQDRGGLPSLVTIDHVLADRRLGIVGYSVEPQPGSDHRQIVAVLALPWSQLSR
jgi:endonuclease/exonuclease/phosphatase (EEP) superfamily protein YafD